uniref:Uncharacterized protein n=1 Tax=Amphiprion percula TaxID=161767 RepID=A0A3P8U4R1_AMPPE
YTEFASFCCDFTSFCDDFEYFSADLSLSCDFALFLWRWLLWHNFMKEHAHLDAWLRLAEQAVASPSPAHFTYSTAKEELRRFERLQREAGSQLVQLDSLTRRNRTLTRMFDGVMRTRLLSSAGECGRRWDNVNQKLESITAGLKVLKTAGFLLIFRFSLKSLSLFVLNPWGWSGTPRWTWDAPFPVTTPIRRTSAPAQVGRNQPEGCSY